MELNFNNIVLDMTEERELWSRHPDFGCFWSDLNNPKGLKLTPEVEVGRVSLKLKIDKYLTGVIGIAHGGVPFTILDGMMGWFLISHLAHSGVTSESIIKYSAPLELNKEYIFEVVLSSEEKIDVKNVPLIGRVRNLKGDIILTLESKFFLPTLEQARKILNMEMDPIISKYFREE